ncbi:MULTISPECIES: LemA family protein [Microbacterium]|uniref:LemA family protein n=1 Tax=Microbacterium TaxID=33882 RepID=UPI0012B839FB|nr:MULTISPECIES: LemA family protein [Microbacterium]MTE24364.1 LemA family protein [Microbacterium sp. ZXX196]NHI16671.1 LemA family protein [Microbacterium excoecariae]
MEWFVPVLIAVAVVVVAGVYLWASYRSLAALEARVQEQWEVVEAALARRAELVPQAIDAVRAHADHEKAVFENASRARGEVLAASGPTAAGAADQHLQASVASLMAVAEGYPALQSDTGFLALSRELVDAENDVQSARRSYNGGAREVNVKIRHFPARMFAGGVGASEREFFEAPHASAVRQPPRVQF